MAMTGRPRSRALADQQLAGGGSARVDWRLIDASHHQKIGTLSQRGRSASSALCTERPDPAARQDTRRASAGARSLSTELHPMAPTAAAISGRPLTKTAASGGRARVRIRSAPAASKAPAVAGGPCVQRRRRTHRPQWPPPGCRSREPTGACASVKACTRGNGLIPAAGPPLPLVRAPRPRPAAGSCRPAAPHSPRRPRGPRRPPERSPASRTVPGSPVPGTSRAPNSFSSDCHSTWSMRRGTGRRRGSAGPGSKRPAARPVGPARGRSWGVGGPAWSCGWAAPAPGDQRESLDQGGGPQIGQPVGQVLRQSRRRRSASPLRCRTGPLSSPASICMMLIPVSVSPLRMACWIGAAPRIARQQRGVDVDHAAGGTTGSRAGECVRRRPQSPGPARAAEGWR